MLWFILGSCSFLYPLDISLPALSVPSTPCTHHTTLSDSLILSYFPGASWEWGRNGKWIVSRTKMAICTRIATSNLMLFILKCSPIHTTANFILFNLFILWTENHFDRQRSAGDVDFHRCGLIPSKNFLTLFIKLIICIFVFYKMLMFR